MLYSGSVQQGYAVQRLVTQGVKLHNEMLWHTCMYAACIPHDHAAIIILMTSYYFRDGPEPTETDSTMQLWIQIMVWKLKISC